MRTGTASVRDVLTEVEAIGTTRANESVTLSTRVTDTVRQVRFDDGDYVEAGAVLVELTNEEETALLAESEATVEEARRAHRRLADLLKSRSVPVSQVDEARARLDAARGRYQSIVARLDDRLVRAPFSGVLGFRQVSAGTLLNPGTAIATLDDIRSIKLDFPVPEVYLDRLRPGLELTASSAAFPGRAFEARVSTLDSRVDPISRAIVVRARIDNGELQLRPGMLMTVRLATNQRRTLMVPEDALLQTQDGAYVYRVEDGQARRQPVDHGVRYQGWVEVTDGLDEGDQVVVEGTIKLRDGSTVVEAAS